MRDDGWMDVVNRRRIRGRLFLSRVAVDEDALLEQLSAMSGGIEAEFKLERASEEEVWIVRWGDEECRIQLVGSEKVSRGMRAIAVLLRAPGTRIAHYLLDGLSRRPGHTRRKDEDAKQRVNGFRAAMRPLCQGVLDEATTVNDAHARLIELLLQHEHIDERFASVPPWSPRVAEASERRASKLSTEYKRTAENVRDSIKAAKEVLRSQGSGAVADFLDKHLARDSHSYLYSRKNAVVSWAVGVAAARAG